MVMALMVAMVVMVVMVIVAIMVMDFLGSDYSHLTTSI